MSDEAAKLEHFPIGQKVRYFSVLSDLTTFHDGEVVSDPWWMGGIAVVKISGRSGAVSIHHLTPLD